MWGPLNQRHLELLPWRSTTLTVDSLSKIYANANTTIEYSQRVTAQLKTHWLASATAPNVPGPLAIAPASSLPPCHSVQLLHGRLRKQSWAVLLPRFSYHLSPLTKKSIIYIWISIHILFHYIWLLSMIFYIVWEIDPPFLFLFL